MAFHKHYGVFMGNRKISGLGGIRLLPTGRYLAGSKVSGLKLLPVIIAVKTEGTIIISFGEQLPNERRHDTTGGTDMPQL
jgi:hypothetical protein